jgi:hypothetical protein
MILQGSFGNAGAKCGQGWRTELYNARSALAAKASQAASILQVSAPRYQRLDSHRTCGSFGGLAHQSCVRIPDEGDTLGQGRRLSQQLEPLPARDG